MGIATRKIKKNTEKPNQLMEDFMLSAANARNQIDGDQNAMNKLKTATQKLTCKIRKHEPVHLV